MTKEEIIEMACQAFGGLIKKEERDNFVAFAKLVAEKEREACAKVCDDELKEWGIFGSNLGDVSKAIRARGMWEYDEQ